MIALRHQIGQPPQEFEVLRLNDDGTADLGRNGELIIAGSIMSVEAKPGTCVLVDASSDKPIEAVKSKKTK
jgi:hypothetical protein